MITTLLAVARWTVAGLLIWTAVAFSVAVVIGRAIHAADPGEDGPDGTAGDLPPVVLTDLDAEFLRLVAPLEPERDARLRGRVIWP